MYPISKDKFINPAQIITIEVEEQSVVDKDGGKKMKVEISMTNGKLYEFTRPKNESVGVVNKLIGMINTANNPFLSLPAQQPEPTYERPKRIPSDGKGAGSHKVDRNVYPKEKKGPDGYPLKDANGNFIYEETPEAVAKREYDAAIKKAVDEGQVPSAPGPVPIPFDPVPVPAPVPVVPAPVVVQEMPNKELPEESTGQMKVPPELQEVGEPEEAVKTGQINVSSAFDGANTPTKENPFG